MGRWSWSAGLVLIVGIACLAAGCGDDGTGPGDDSPGGEHLWSKRYGGDYLQCANDVCLGASACPIMAGVFADTVDFGGGALPSAGGRDFFLAKFGPDGAHAWSKGFGNGDTQNGVRVAVDPWGGAVLAGELLGAMDFGGGVLTSAGSQDAFLARFNGDGSHLWSKRFGDGELQTARGVAVDASGNILLTGCLQGSTDFGGGPLTSAGLNDVFVARFDPDGGHVWSVRFGDADLQTSFAVAADASGNVIITGLMAGSVDFGGGALTSGGGYDAFVAKLAPDGTHLWSRRFGDENEQYGVTVACDAAGNVVVAGLLKGAVDFGGGALTSAGLDDVFVAKFGPDGTHLWSQRFGDANVQSVNAVAVEADGGIALAGDFYGTVDFGGGELVSAGRSDAYLAKFDASGAHLWSRRFGDTDYDHGYGVAVDPGGQRLALVGGFCGTVDFGGGPLTEAGAMDVFCAVFRP